MVGGLMVLGCLGDEGVDWEGPGWEDELLEFFSAWTEWPDFRRSGLFRRSFGRVFWFGGFGWLGIRWRGTGGIWLRLRGGWTVGAHLEQLSGVRIHRLDFPPTVSHLAPDSSVLTVNDKGEVGVLIPADVGETTGASFSLFVKTGGRVLVRLFRGLLPQGNCREVTHLATVPADRFSSRDDYQKSAPFHIQPVGNRVEGLNI